MGKERKGWVGRRIARLSSRSEPPPALLVREDGFSFLGPDQETRVRWSDVKEIFAFKRDLFSVDLICIGFRVQDDGTFCEIDEMMPGYGGLLAVLPDVFPGFKTDWSHDVAIPAFATNLATLWGEPKIAAIWQAE